MSLCLGKYDRREGQEEEYKKSLLPFVIISVGFEYILSPYLTPKFWTSLSLNKPFLVLFPIFILTSFVQRTGYY